MKQLGEMKMYNNSKLAIGLAAALLIGTASIAQAGGDSGDYKGGSLYGPMPGQVLGLGQGQSAYGFGRGAYAYAWPRGREAYAYAGPRRLRRADAGHYRWHWEEYQ